MVASAHLVDELLDILPGLLVRSVLHEVFQFLYEIMTGIFVGIASS